MIVSQTNLKLSNWMCLAVFLLAIGVLPIGLVYAQDYEAVQKRLVEAVKAGEISRAQAGAMLETLKGSDKSRQGGDRDMEALKRRYPERVRRIEAAVEAGEVSKEDAEKRLIEMRKAMFPETGTKSKLRDNKSKTKNGKEMASLEARKKVFQQSEKIIQDAVKSGKISKEDAEKRLGQMRADMFPEFEDKSKGGNNKDKAGKEKVDRQMEGKKNRYMKAAAGIEAEVKAGKISKEDAEKRLIEMRKAMFPATDQDKAKRGGDPDMEAALEGLYIPQVSKRPTEMVKAMLQLKAEADEKAAGQRRRRLFPRNGG